MLLVTGAISILINQRYVAQQIVESNAKAVSQIQSSFDLTFDELDSLSVSFSASPQFLQSLNSIITSKKLTLEQSQVLTTISNFINVSAFSRPYIYSIYVYIENPGDKLLTTTNSIVDRKGYYDTSWYRDFKSHPLSDLQWTQARTLTPLSNSTDRVPVLTIFHRIYSLSGFREPGVVVLNIDRSYVDRVIDRLKALPTQQIAVMGADGTLLAGSLPHGLAAGATRGPFSVTKPMQRRIEAGGKPYIEVAITSKRYGWTYESFTPLSVFYRASSKLRDINLAIVVLSFLIGLILTIYASRRSFRQIQSVVATVQAAEGGTPLPAVPDARDTGFGQITYSIIRTFVEHEYLKIQLSEREYRQRTLELLALQSQLNPHFLFNTLETINWNVIQATGGPTKINEMINSLSRVLSYSLESPFKLETLQNEIKHAKDYVAIQQIRYKGKFTVEWRHDPRLDTHKVIRFLLQPLIENSIYHGIKETPGNHVIEVVVERSSAGIRITVSDDGRGIEPERLREINKTLSTEDLWVDNIGLYNTKKRIQLAFGDRYGLKVTSTFGVGTQVSVEIPATV